MDPRKQSDDDRQEPLEIATGSDVDPREILAQGSGPEVDRKEFEAALGALLRTVERSDVEVTRALDLEADSDGYRWMVDISRVRSRRDVPTD